MRGTAVRVLDDGYLEFLEALRELGELDSLSLLIADFSGAGGGTRSVRPEMNRAIHAFWMMGWIEVREITKKGKYGIKKNYRLKVCLDKIAGHFEQERMRRSTLTADAFRLHKMPVTA
jgi:predicted transcriptional regulator